MRILLLIIALLTFLPGTAQDIKGTWKGTLYQSHDREYYFEIRVESVDQSGKVKGTTYIKEEVSGNFGTISYSGSFDGKKFSFQEIEILKEDKNKSGYYPSNNFYWCIKNGTIDFVESGDHYKMSGPWKAAGTCPGGTLVVRKQKPKQLVEAIPEDDCSTLTSADFMLGAWRGKFKQHACGVNATYPMVVYIDKVNDLKFSGMFIWTDMQFAEDSRSTLEGEIKNGQVYFYENEIISGSGLVLNGTYKSKLINCDQLDGYWYLEKIGTQCNDPQVLKNGGDYNLDHYVIPTVYFDHASAELKPDEKKKLDEFAQFMKDFPTLKFEMRGHTDNTGSSALNLRLSEERAKIVIDYLVSKGLSAKRFSFSFYAHTKPAQKNDSEVHKQLNRRTEIVVRRK